MNSPQPDDITWLATALSPGPLLMAWCHLGAVARNWGFTTMGIDAVVLDLQHGDIDEQQLPTLIPTLEQHQVQPLARLRSHEPAHIGRVLDSGIHGIIAPQVESARQASDIVAASRYPPRGHRSYGPQGRFRGTPVCIAQIETAAGLHNVAELAATPGVDALYIGPWDLGIALGAHEPGRLDDPLVGPAINTIATACVAHGRPWGVHTTNTLAALEAHRLGAQLINVVADQAVLAAHAEHVRDDVHRLRQPRP